ncbi:hypothetical protein RFI_06074 [Reticulomyxa filosa]|uniref:Mitochondrial import inner membrane translocase subunit TIM50 n=1 Tax=Reticulomyxa filosa TaxID=46433 RepID=X6NYH8_RETFI|nr:hypothetical protein RFI_06074 [Reticulomyxa filosa]|eukprot:ETO31046.1 hypothetical protein RFI_06074 [Reticulomyxa filosa]
MYANTNTKAPQQQQKETEQEHQQQEHQQESKFEQLTQKQKQYGRQESPQIPIDSNDNNICSTSPLLPPELIKSKRRLLVMDLDETMIYTSFKKLNNYDFTIPVIHPSGHLSKLYVKKRPFLNMFLQECSNEYDIVVFTAAGPRYASEVLDHIDVRSVISHLIFGDSVTRFADGKYIKDLELLGKPLKDVILVDDTPDVYAKHPKNAVPIGKFKGEENDEQVQINRNYLFFYYSDNVQNVLDTNQSFEWLCNKAAMDGKPVRHVIYYYHYFNVFTSFISQINKYAWNNSSWDEYKIFKQSATCSGRTNSRESTEERERREKDRNKRSL